MAITKTDIFDFLVDILPSEELRNVKAAEVPSHHLLVPILGS